MGVWDILAWIVMGALVGWLASVLMGTDEKQGAVGNILVGVIGAFVGGFVMSLFEKSGVNASDAFSWRSFFVSLLGAVVVLFLYKLAAKRL